ncbi:ESF2 [[Candida] subhashii]|uniref:ESF2 n=1 Tax=[Candida] subhashii TaxID=561895 RepID=A0A8J5QLF4_9ASCO|nr:ESF2 [[Candida] subhashii]KAG7662557.1 ESF2 [[Candida] subhashii]
MKTTAKFMLETSLTSDDEDFDDADNIEPAGEGIFNFKSKSKPISRPFGDQDEEEEEQEENDEVEEEYSDPEKRRDDADYGSEVEENDEGEQGELEGDKEEGDDELDESKSSTSKNNKKLKKLTSEELEKEQKRIKRTGVCYLSRIPPYMKPSKLRSVLSRFGAIDRLFLKPEDSAIYHKRVKYGGNKKKNFTEGWVEFVNKKDAKLCASTLNGNKLGGKKTSYYYDDIINIKYLSGFKWLDLTQQIAKENEVRQAKLALELSHQQKLNKSFINNVEKSKMITNIQKKRKQKSDSKNDNPAEDEIRRNFKQRRVTSTRSEASEQLKEKARPDDKLSSILSNVF